MFEFVIELVLYTLWEPLVETLMDFLFFGNLPSRPSEKLDRRNMSE